MKPKIIIIDGTSFIYRAFYAVRDLGTSHIATNAIYGFVSMIKTLQKRYKNIPMICVFDAKGPNFRHQIYPEYKGHRPPPPDDLIVQIPYIHKMVDAFGIPVFTKEGIEADDIIGTLAKHYVSDNIVGNGLDAVVHILTGDKDFAQLVSPHIHLYNSMTDELLDESAVVEKFGVKPSQIIDYLTLVGDTVDNIPGVLKCGPVTARKWLNQYDTLDNMIANKEHLTGNVGENFRTAIDWLYISRQLVTIDCNIDLSQVSAIDIKKVGNNIPDHKALYELFVELRFNRWLSELKKELSQSGTPSAINQQKPEENSLLFSDISQFNIHINKVIDQNLESGVNILFEKYNDYESKALVLQISYYENNQFIVVNLKLEDVFKNSDQRKTDINIQEDLFSIIEDAPDMSNNQDHLANKLKCYLLASVAKITFNSKALYYFLDAYFDLDAADLNQTKQLYDVSVLAYVLDSAEKFNLLQLLNNFYVQFDITDDSFEVESYFGGKTIYTQCADITKNELCKIYSSVISLHKILMSHLSDIERNLYLNIELPLVCILVQMEQIGIKISISDFKQMEMEISARLQILEQNIYKAAGVVFNINSPKQLQEILYQRLGISTSGIAKNDNGYSTDEQSLQILQQQGVEIASSLLEYRYLAKILNTYVLALPKQVDSHNRLHTTFEQTAVISGRLSSRNPNLQNIPAKHDYGKRIRDAFIVEPEYEMLKADYSQIELRLLAYFSKDKNLLQAFAENKDIHISTAMEIFNKSDVSAVSAIERRYAKTINFGIIYGQSAFSLAKELGISNSDAKEYIKRYFAQFPAVQSFIHDTQEKAVLNGHVETLFGRKIYLKQINSKNHAVKQGQLRLSVNAILQGSAADIIKVAMIRIANYLRENNNKSSMLLQVHDELVFQILQQEAETLIPVLKELMIKDFPLKLVV